MFRGPKKIFQWNEETPRQGRGMNSLTWKRGSKPITHVAMLFLVASLSFTGGVYAQNPGGHEPMVIKVIRLDHADAAELASVLRPLLTKDGRITAYSPTNMLIIRDKKSLVEQLVKLIKGTEAP